MPREKRLPEAKTETKWEKYAKEKGIQKTKKERMVWNEATQQFAPRWGYKRPEDGIGDLGIVEIKKSQNRMVDPYAVAREDKKAKKVKNLSQQIRNEGLKKGTKKKGYDMYDAGKVPGIPAEMVGKKRGKEGVRSALQLVQHSTASLGRFDEMRTGEPMRKIKGKKNTFKDNIGAGTDKVISQNTTACVSSI